MKNKSIILSVALASMLQAEQIKSIEFINLTKISPSVASETLDIRTGDEITIEKINSAIKKFYKFNYFNDISVFNEKGKLQFVFKERPSIVNVEIEGYKQRDDDIELLKKQINVNKGNMYSSKRIKKAKETLHKILESEGYINSVVEVDVENLSEDSVSVIFNVNKGDEIIIKKVNYFGSEELAPSDLETVTFNKEEEFASWFISQNGGELNTEQLKYDGKRIQELYFEKGYLDVKLKDPFLEVDFSSSQAELDFYIDEGKQYRVNSVTVYVNSDIIDSKEIYPELTLKKDRVFNVKKLRKDTSYIKTVVADLGYAFTQVKYDIKKDQKNGTADLIYNVIPGEKVYIRDVKISGNTRTLDRVIRRNVYLAPKDEYSLTDFNDSKNKLKRTGYFEDVTIKQKRVSENELDLLVDVKEASTGNVILGGGYGSSDGFMINGAINERNIFGSGLTLGINADLSKDSTNLSVKVINPAIKDSKYHGDIDIHSNKREIDGSVFDQDKKVRGISVGFGREIMRNLNVGARYRLDFIKELYDYEASSTVPLNKRYENTEYITSSITPYLKFDNTDDYLTPRSGFKTGTSLEIAGLGGDSKYLKSSSYLKYFYSLEDAYELDWILRYKAQLNLLVDNGQLNQGDSLYLGGIRTVRGFKSNSIPQNETGVKIDPYKAMAANSIEMSFPLSEQAKVRWGLFYDYGMIGEDSFTDEKRSSTGAVVEWMSPFGPLQLIFAQPLDDKPGDDTSSFEFSLGQSF